MGGRGEASTRQGRCEEWPAGISHPFVDQCSKLAARQGLTFKVAWPPLRS